MHVQEIIDLANQEGAGLVPILLAVAGLVGLGGGLTAIVAAVLRWRRGRRAALAHTAATGRIADRYLPSGSARHSDGPQYTIDFTTADGRVVRFTTDSVGLSPRKVGDDVDVLYDPAAPADAVVRGGERTAAYLLGIGGIVFTIVGLLMALAALDQMLQ